MNKSILFSINKLLTKKFCTTSATGLSKTKISEPISIPYNRLQHGDSLEAFRQHTEFRLFHDKYYALVDQLLFLACKLELPKTTLQSLSKNLNHFKERLFNPAYCNARPNVLWNSAREHLEILVVLLKNPKISKEKCFNIINDVDTNLPMCSEGIVSHLQEAIQGLVNDGETILSAKEILVQQLAIEFILDRKWCTPVMQVHYVNAFINYFADALGLNKRPHEQTVTADNPLLQEQVSACWKTINEKLPVALVSYLSDKLYLAAGQVLHQGKLEEETWQQFSNLPIAQCFLSATIKQALFIEGEQIGHFSVPADARSLHWLVARELMDQGWLQSQENRHLMDLDDGSLFTLADYWFWRQSKENREDQRPLTAEELLKLYMQITQSQLDQTAPLPRLAVRVLELAVEQGSAEGQYQFCLMHLTGKGIDVDIAKAFQLYHLAADQGHVLAPCNFTEMDENDYGTDENKQVAFRFLQLAADRGHAQAQYNLGVLYELGFGTDKNEQKAFKFYQLAADQGFAEAQYNLGIFYLKGEGVAKDYQTAFQLLKLAADQGYALAQCQLGVLYENGYGTDKNEQKAFKFYQLAADQGFAGAQYNLGIFYLKGKGVAKDYQTAFQLLKLAADQKHIEAKNALSKMNQQIYNNEQQTVSSSSHQSEAELSRLQNRPMTEEILTTQPTLPNHTVLAEVMVSLNEQQQTPQRVAIAKRGTFADAMLTSLHSDQFIEVRKR